jgi:GNAT superfamily N-acetyltransferase
MQVSYSYSYTPEWSVRVIDEYDLSVASDFYMALQKEEYSEEEADREAWIMQMSRLMKEGNYVGMLAYKGGKPVGFGDFIVYPEPATGKLHSKGMTFYVLPEYRKTKAGHKIYSLWRRTAKNMGVSEMILECTESNVDMWSKAGFVPKNRIMGRKI